MYRSLRFQLIAIVLVTVATVLVVSQWLDTRLSERALQQDLTERALLVLHTVDSVWGNTTTGECTRSSPHWSKATAR